METVDSVLGINVGETTTGKKLRDGAACVVTHGQPTIAIAEERLTRVKHAGGFDSCLQALQSYIPGVDLVCLSSCCDPSPDTDLYSLRFSQPVVAVNHHLSHASSVFYTSPFEESLILVTDAGGNTLTAHHPQTWWQDSREQLTCFIGQGNRIHMPSAPWARDFDHPYQTGPGEAYRAFTHYLGFESYTRSAHTMALAPYGDPQRYSNAHLFDFNSETGHLTSHMINRPPDPIGMVTQWAQDQEIQLPPPRHPHEEIQPAHADLARFIQDELEFALAAKVNYLVTTTHIRNLCLTGGVALNCVANRHLLDQTPIDALYINPTAGDHGQALGNALRAYWSRHPYQSRELIRFNPYLGPEYSPQDIETVISSRLAQTNLSRPPRKSPDPAGEAATLIADGKIVAWFQGRSEWGPRALGGRSLVADPRNLTTISRLRDIKQTAWYRPYAPSILQEEAHRWFDIPVESPYMLLVAQALPGVTPRVPGVVHIDGSSRLHTVNQSDNPRFHKLISQFARQTDIPMVLNTSFNGPHQPIVESPTDAINAFQQLGLDALVIGDWVIEK